MHSSTLSTIIDFLRQHAPFDHMAPAHLEFLAKRFRLAFFAQGEIVLSSQHGPAAHFYTIKQGSIRGEAEGADNNSSAWLLVGGECFPVGALLSHRPVRMTYRAVEDTFCYRLERSDFEKLISQSPVFHDFCTRRMANLLDKALRGIQARSATNVSSNNSLNTPIKLLIHRDPISSMPETPIREVLKVMESAHIGSMIVTDKESRPIGIFTLHDLLSRVAIKGLDLDTPIKRVMTKNRTCLPPEAPAYEAALQMTRHGVGHLCVTDNKKRLIGVLSERDLFSLQRIGLVSLSRAIARAEDVDTLRTHAKEIHKLVEQMIAQGASVMQLTQLITELNDAIAQRAIALLSAGRNLPEFSWISFGSEGRFEQTLKTDQDNGILFKVPEGESNDSIRAKLLPFAKEVNNALDVCGYPLCPGNIMASNPECCLSLKEWKKQFKRWIAQGEPEHLLKSAIYFDFRHLYGDSVVPATLRKWLTEKVAKNSRFRQLLASSAMQFRPPLGIFGDFRTNSRGNHPNTLDLKTNGITPFVDTARIYAFAAGVTDTNTSRRLEGACENGYLNKEDTEAWNEAYQFIQLLRMRHHYQLAEAGQELDNHVDPDRLNELDRRILKEAFRQARKLQSRLALDYQL